MTNQLREIVEQLLSSYVADTVPDPMKLRDSARRLNLLPLVNDMSGCFGIRPSGEIVSFPWDHEVGLRIERDPQVHSAILYQGSLRYPALREFVPSRPDNAVPCPGCGGSGKLEGVPANCVCECGGLGWIPSAKDQAPREPA